MLLDAFTQPPAQYGGLLETAPTDPGDPADAGKGTMPAPTPMAPEQTALLNAIRGGESPGDAYNIRFNGTPQGATFDSYADHPRVLAPIPWRRGWNSDAAGPYQFISTTWDKVKGDAPDFSPPYQDRAAWELAQQAYARKYPGRDLLGALQSGNTSTIAPALSGEWESIQTQPKQFNQRLQQALQANVASQ